MARRVATTVALALVLSAAAGAAPAFATSVSNVSAAPSTTAAGATGVAYTVDFTTSFAGSLVSPTGEITLTGPAGTFTGASFSAFDTTQSNRNLGASVFSNNGTTVVLRVSTSTATGAGDAIQVRITDANNSTAGAHTFDVSTSSDTTPATSSPAYTLVAAQPVTAVSVAPSTTAAGATGVAYTVNFTTSSSGQLVFPGEITLTGPAGTFTGASFSVFDTTQSNRNLGAGVVSNDGATVVLRVSTSTATGPGDALQVSITDANNSTAGPHTFDVSTSSDTTPVTSPSYTLVAAQAVSSVSVVPSTPAAGATGVAYTVDFTTSSTGQLVFPGEITLTGPAGTFSGASFSVFDTTAANRNLGAGVASNDGTTVVLRIGSSTATAGGNALQVRITDANNSTAGPHTFDVSTSSDTTPVTSPSYTLSTAQTVSSTSVATSTAAAGATGVAYTVDFTTSSTGQLVFPGEITLTGPTGTFTGASFSVFDTTAANRNLGAGVASNDGTTVVLRIGSSTATAAGNALQVRITDANNSTAGAHTFDISTSSDTPAVTTPAYNLVAAQAVSNVSVAPSTTTEGATGVTYIVDFTTSSTGQLVFPGEITLTAPAGTFAGASFTVFDTTDANRNLGAGIASNDGTTAVLRIGSSTATGAGHALQVRVTNAHNSTAGPHTFDIVTSSDTTPVTSPAYTLGADTTPPSAAIISGPSGTTPDSTATFEFSSSEPGSTFACSVDGGPFIACSSPFSTPPLAAGPHTFNLRATDSAGNSTVVGRDWTVATAGPKTLADLPPAVLGKVANVEEVSGKVLVAVPASSARAHTAQKGLKFVPLNEARQIPIGSFLDTRKGTVALQSAATGGKSQQGNFTSGLFQVLQSRKRSAKGLTDLVLKGGRFSSCAARKPRGKRAQAALSRRALRRLRGNAKGKFRTRGRYSAATVRGTKWTVTDRCDGTLTKVARGRVAVRDFRRKKTVIVKTGKSYLARARR